MSGWLADALASAYPEARDLATTLERPRDAAHGDFASNAAMVAARALKRNPREIATRIVAALAPSELVAKAEVAGAGFINVTLAPAARQAVVARVLAEGDAFGRSDARRGERVMVEFVSANPTGPLHVGHGRQAVLGDAIAALFAAEGADVTREFYYNDAGAQIDNLARSVRARIREREGVAEPFPEDGYRGDYIRELAVRYVDEKGDPDDMDALRRFAVAALRAEQDVDLRAIGVVFDNFYLESSL